MSGIVGLSPNMKSGIVGRFPSYHIVQHSVSPVWNASTTSGNMDMNSHNMIFKYPYNDVIVHGYGTFVKKSTTAGNSGNIYLIGSGGISEVTVPALGDGFVNEPANIPFSFIRSISTGLTTNIDVNYKMHMGNSNGSSIEVKDAYLHIFEVMKR